MARFLDFGLDNIDIWRSQEMQLVQLMIPSESAHDTVAALGELGLLQFKDLNATKSAFQKTYASQVKRCDEMARKLRFFNEQVTKAEVYLIARPFTGTADKRFDLDELETTLEQLEAEVLEVNSNTERLQRSKSELDELQLVLEKAGSFFDSARSYAHVETFESGITEDIGAPLLDSALAAEQKSGRLGFVAGLIQQEKLIGFERLLFRATRGNVFLKTAAVGSVMDPMSGEVQEKSVFMVFFSGERARTKILKICEAFNANRYPFPEEPQRQRQMNSDVTARLRELQHTIEAGQRHRQGLLQNIANNIDEWTQMVSREKAIFHTMNKFSVDVTHKVLVAEAWVPTSAKSQVHEALRRSMEQGSTQVATILQPLVTHDAPPTYFKTTLFTESFQTIVDAYGVARYREANPTMYTIITFPFLFAIMFGDFGHGWLLFLFGLYLVVNQKKWIGKELNDMFSMIFGGRYVILLMGVFSIYVGLLYNEFFSFPMSFFGGTRYRCCDFDHFNASTGVCSKPITPPGDDMRNCIKKGSLNNIVYFADSFGEARDPYPMGLDPIWHGTKTELPYLNSLKMKMSIIIAVVHMNLGIIHSVFNHLYFHDWLSIYTEFIPQMLFFNSVFGYLSILIVNKWNTQSVLDTQYCPSSKGCPAWENVSAHPDLYNVMITLFLNTGQPDRKGHAYKGQTPLQGFLLLVALVSVPWMLIPKPMILKKRHEAHLSGRQASEEYGMLRTEDEEDGGRTPGAADHNHSGSHSHGDHFEFSEVLVHQMIHTIEFVLGAISNTASYLRLWALSLAHSQLSAVFYDRVLMLTVSMAAGDGEEAGGLVVKAGPVIAMIIGFAVFFGATMGVLMVMESLSAFLHALRLHWVEFMNKFYAGDGYPFVPFVFESKPVD